MSSGTDQRTADLAALRWLEEVGVTETVADQPVNRYEQAAAERSAAAPSERQAAPLLRKRPATRADARQAPAGSSPTATADHARRAAAECATLDELRQVIESFEGCPLKQEARSTVFADGNPASRVMFVGEAPGEEEDRLGRPFVGRSGRLLDRAVAYAGLRRDADRAEDSFYITNIVFWRPHGNRTPTADETLTLLPFTERHIQLAAPEILVLLGNVACKSLMRTDTGIMKLRGNWLRWMPEGGGTAVPALPTFHPSFLLRTPRSKQKFWSDLLSLREKLDEIGSGHAPS